MSTTIDAHVSALGRAMRGPARLRRSMLREVRDGLDDATSAYVAGGLDTSTAATLAVADFGTVEELASQYRAELTARQGRTAAMLVTLLFPTMVLAWGLLWHNGAKWSAPLGAETAQVIRILASVEDVASLGLAMLAAVLFGLTFLRAVPPRPLAALAGITAGFGALLNAGTVVAMNVLAGTRLLEAAAPIAYAISAAALVLVLVTATCTVRAALA